jgi:spore maturation protein CgeB
MLAGPCGAGSSVIAEGLRGKRLMVFDGISGVPLAKELHAALRAEGVDAVYIDGQQLRRKPLYDVRSKLSKTLDKLRDTDGFYHLPKVSDRAFATQLEETCPHVLLIVGFLYRFVSPSLVAQLKREKGFSLILYDTDSCNLYSRRREFIFFLEKELPIYDRILSFSRVTTDLFCKVRGLYAEYFPFGAQPISGAPDVNQKIDVLFVGSADLRRILLLEKIRDRVTIYGSRWERHRRLMSAQLKTRVVSRPVWGEELHALLHASKIILNITRSDFFGAETGINLRIFEALAAGCFLLTDDCDELRELFRPGEELEIYRSSAELAEKVSYYLRHDGQRRAIAARGHERFLRDFTWQARVRDFLGRSWA